MISRTSWKEFHFAKSIKDESLKACEAMQTFVCSTNCQKAKEHLAWGKKTKICIWFCREKYHGFHTFWIESISPWINLGGVQLIPTATTLLHELAIEAHSINESPLTTFTPSFELKENQAGIFILFSSRSSAYACKSTDHNTVRTSKFIKTFFCYYKSYFNFGLIHRVESFSSCSSLDFRLSMQPSYAA